MRTDLPKHLLDISPEDFKISRKRRGPGKYIFTNGNGKNLANKKTLEIVKNIPVPDTWTEVTLSDSPQTYILARGYDGSGKLQYFYHPDYLAFRNEYKFDQLAEFGFSLPKIRKKISKDLSRAEWDERKLLALIVRILDKYHLRIGSRIYAKKNNSFGLTTLRKKHLQENEDSLTFDFIGKSGQHQTINLTDQTLVKLLQEVAEFPGWELFSFPTKDGKFAADANKVNQYIREISGGNFSARNFRTWAGTVLSIKYLPKALKEIEKNPKRKLSAVLVDYVSEKLGNTTAVCREYYIHPKVLNAALCEDFNCVPGNPKFLKNPNYTKEERRALEILTS